jgi:XTP/dITP diphosphohydrolase
MPRRLLIATGNAHKIVEIRSILSALLPDSIEIVGLADVRLAAPPADVESFQTFSANARAKAAWCSERSGLACVADDSGLCVDALGGAPGVRSARWAGPTDTDRNNALLAELRRVNAIDPAHRQARFVCSAAIASPEGSVVNALGQTYGRIIDSAHGATGFGYDPLFYCPELAATFAEAGEEAKNRVSHRGRALALLASHIDRFVP